MRTYRFYFTGSCECTGNDYDFVGPLADFSRYMDRFRNAEHNMHTMGENPFEDDAVNEVYNQVTSVTSDLTYRNNELFLVMTIETNTEVDEQVLFSVLLSYMDTDFDVEFNCETWVLSHNYQRYEDRSYTWPDGVTTHRMCCMTYDVTWSWNERCYTESEFNNL